MTAKAARVESVALDGYRIEVATEEGTIVVDSNEGDEDEGGEA